jgi:hypothetical protein
MNCCCKSKTVGELLQHTPAGLRRLRSLHERYTTEELEEQERRKSGMSIQESTSRDGGDDRININRNEKSESRCDHRSRNSQSRSSECKRKERYCNNNNKYNRNNSDCSRNDNRRNRIKKDGGEGEGIENMDKKEEVIGIDADTDTDTDKNQKKRKKDDENSSFYNYCNYRYSDDSELYDDGDSIKHSSFEKEKQENIKEKEKEKQKEKENTRNKRHLLNNSPITTNNSCSMRKCSDIQLNSPSEISSSGSSSSNSNSNESPRRRNNISSRSQTKSPMDNNNHKSNHDSEDSPKLTPEQGYRYLLKDNEKSPEQNYKKLVLLQRHRTTSGNGPDFEKKKTFSSVEERISRFYHHKEIETYKTKSKNNSVYPSPIQGQDKNIAIHKRNNSRHTYPLDENNIVDLAMLSSMNMNLIHLDPGEERTNK